MLVFSIDSDVSFMYENNVAAAAVHQQFKDNSAVPRARGGGGGDSFDFVQHGPAVEALRGVNS